MAFAKWRQRKLIWLLLSIKLLYLYPDCGNSIAATSQTPDTLGVIIHIMVSNLLRIAFVVIALLFFSYCYSQDSVRIKAIEKRILLVDSIIEYSKKVHVFNARNDKYYVDTFRKELLKVISNNAPALGQTVGYYFQKGSLIKAVLQQEVDSNVQFVEHRYFRKKKQIFEKLDSTEDIAIVSWESQIFIRQARAFLIASRKYIKTIH